MNPTGRSGSGGPASRAALAETRAWVSGLVRSGLDTPEDVRRQVIEAVAADHPGLDADTAATDLIALARDEWLADAMTWATVTDHDRLQTAFAALEDAGVVVLQGCADHWVAHDLLTAREPSPRGIVWFTAPDVWHAVDEGMLEVNLWHGTTANAAPGDALLDEVIATFAAAGLEAGFEDGRIEVAAFWQRRPGS